VITCRKLNTYSLYYYLCGEHYQEEESSSEEEESSEDEVNHWECERSSIAPPALSAQSARLCSFSVPTRRRVCE
jgi:hypothetical protein